MDHNFPHVKAMLQRQFAPGALILLLIAAASFTPRLLDVIRGEPWIGNELAISLNSSNLYIVEDFTYSPGAISGVRSNIVEDESGSIICSHSEVSTWIGERKKFWHLPAFAGCYATPIVPFKVCSKFTVESESGRRRDFGPFCSAPIYPEITPNEQLQKIDPPGTRT